jgi:hypothetical protein
MRVEWTDDQGNSHYIEGDSESLLMAAGSVTVAIIGIRGNMFSTEFFEKNEGDTIPGLIGLLMLSGRDPDTVGSATDVLKEDGFLVDAQINAMKMSRAVILRLEGKEDDDAR